MRTITSRVGALGSFAALIACALFLTARIEAQTTRTARLVEEQHVQNPAGPYCSDVENGRFADSLVLGDLDGDGRDDLLVAAPSNGSLSPGAFIYYSTGSGFRTQPDVQIGLRTRGVAMADVNGDGIQDIVLVAIGTSIYVFHGRAERFPSEMRAADADWVKSVPVQYGLSGSVASLDVNVDGIDDIVVGGPLAGPESALVFYGSPTGLPADLQPDAVIRESPTLADNIGTDGLHYSITGGFERVTRDGNLCDADNPQTPCGSQFAIGVPGTGIDFNASGYLDANERNVGIALVGPRWQFLSGDKLPYSEFGYRLGHAGDVNGDGETDLVVSAKRYSTRPAKVFVYLGTSAGFAKMNEAYAWAVEETLGGPFVQFGATVGSAGDINGDGYGDIFIGDPRYDNRGGRPQTAVGWWGRAFIYFGGPATAGDASGLGLSAAPADITLPGEGISGEFGYAYAHGDINGDGATDIVVGDPRGAANCFDRGTGTTKFTDVGIAWVYLSDVDQDGDGRTGVSGRDCDDHDPSVFPGSPERWDGKDNDCNGQVDDGVTGDFVSFVTTNAAMNEVGTTSATLTLTRSGPLSDPLAVSYTVGGTAMAGSDYTALSGVATFAANESSTTITIAALNDTLIEQAETVVLTLVDGDRYMVRAPATATVSIVSDEGVTVAATDATASEAGPTTGWFTVSRTAGSLLVFYSVSGTATSGLDYVPLAGFVTIPSGAQSAAIRVTPIDDALMEGSETVVVTLSPAAGYAVGTPDTAVVTIISDERVSVVASDPTATEIGPTVGVFTVIRTGATGASLTVYYSISGTATPRLDYLPLFASVVIPAGASSAPIMVQPINDNLPENNESVAITLLPSSSYTIGSPNAAIVTIIDGSPW